MSDSPQQIAYPFKVGAESQACQQLSRFDFADLRESRRELLIDLAFDAVELFFAIADSEQRHARAVGEKIFGIESGVAGDEAGARSQLGQRVVRGRAGCRSLSARFCFQESSAVE